jgi:uncharacterized membrane protein YphA (DoxX/SURF4 family)
MTKLYQFFFQPTKGSASLLLIRLPVGLIFLTQGILKFINSNMGVVRFARIGFAHPYFMTHFVGCFEIVCGGLVLLGLWTRAASIPLLIIITTATATTKIPELSRANQGFWYMVSDARTDSAMFCWLLFLIVHGTALGRWMPRANPNCSSDVPAGGRLEEFLTIGRTDEQLDTVAP